MSLTGCRGSVRTQFAMHRHGVSAIRQLLIRHDGRSLGRAPIGSPFRPGRLGADGP
jgi:hypothetical protein